MSAAEEFGFSDLYRGGSVHVEHHGSAWMICNEAGVNVAHGPSGQVLLGSEAAALEVLERLSGGGSADEPGTAAWREKWRLIHAELDDLLAGFGQMRWYLEQLGDA